jgi:hypothetical protein
LGGPRLISEKRFPKEDSGEKFDERVRGIDKNVGCGEFDILCGLW